MDIGADRRRDRRPRQPARPRGRVASCRRSTRRSGPNEIGSPFAISGPGYFTDAAHQNHLHIGFKEPITPDWKPPRPWPPTARRGRAARRGRRGRPGARRAGRGARRRPRSHPLPRPPSPRPPPAEPPPKCARRARSCSCRPSPRKAPRPRRKAVSGNDSLAFLKAVEPPKATRRRPARGRGRRPPSPSPRVGRAAAPDAYPGDDAPREQIAAWMAGQAEKRGLPPELPLMASLVESGMKNLNFGDADSVGFFQMRVGIWNQGAYAGYPDKPELQVKWFLDNAETVKKRGSRPASRSTDPNQLRRLDRRRRAPGRAVPRPLPDQARRGPGPAQEPPAAPRRRARGRPPRRRSPARRPGRRRRQLARGRGAAASPRPSAASREVGGANRGPQVDRVPRRGQGRAGQPVVRVVHHLVAGEGRAQDAGRRLGRASRPGCATPSRATTASRSSAPRTRGPETSSPTTGAARTTSAPTATSGSSTATSRTASSPPWRATTPTRSTASRVSRRRREHRLHPRRGQRPAGGAVARSSPAPRSIEQAPAPAAAARQRRSTRRSSAARARAARPAPRRSRC